MYGVRESLPLPREYGAHFVRVHGVAGGLWLDALPDRIERWRARFGLLDVRAAWPAATSLFFSVELRGGGRALLKASPAAEALAIELEALRAFGPQRAAIVYDAAPDEDAILIEHIEPGVPLAAAADETDALAIVAGLLAPGWPAVPAHATAPLLAELTSVLERAILDYGPATCPIDYRALQRAHAICHDLLDSSPVPSLLHGDLHYANILTSGRARHLLVDPRGVIGDPAFDAGYFVSRTGPSARDALPLDRAIDRRLGVLAEAIPVDPHRVAAFAYVAAALSAVWALEDRDEALDAFKAALAILEARLPA
jgi:streptomycin 6-kinase